MDTNTFHSSFPMLMTTCVKHIREHVNAKFSEAGFTVTSDQWAALFHLSQQDGLTQQDLADRYGRSKVAVFNLLQRLEKGGLVVRHPDPVDGRSRRVYLTPDGRRTVAEMNALVAEIITEMREGISDEEIEVLISVVTRITENLKR